MGRASKRKTAFKEAETVAYQVRDIRREVTKRMQAIEEIYRPIFEELRDDLTFLENVKELGLLRENEENIRLMLGGIYYFLLMKIENRKLKERDKTKFYRE